MDEFGGTVAEFDGVVGELRAPRFSFLLLFSLQFLQRDDMVWCSKSRAYYGARSTLL